MGGKTLGGRNSAMRELRELEESEWEWRTNTPATERDDSKTMDSFMYKSLKKGIYGLNPKTGRHLEQLHDEVFHSNMTREEFNKLKIAGKRLGEFAYDICNILSLDSGPERLYPCFVPK